MKDNERIITWINTLLRELSKQENADNINRLHACGKACSTASPLLKGARYIRNQFPADTDSDTLFHAFKTKYYNTPRLTKTGETITLIFDTCTCPLVKQGASHPFLCHCTVGYSIHIFQTLFASPVSVKLEKSILNGDEICRQVITINEE